jgi:hypothetical protein
MPNKTVRVPSLSSSTRATGNYELEFREAGGRNETLRFWFGHLRDGLLLRMRLRHRGRSAEQWIGVVATAGGGGAFSFDRGGVYLRGRDPCAGPQTMSQVRLWTIGYNVPPAQAVRSGGRSVQGLPFRLAIPGRK